MGQVEQWQILAEEAAQEQDPKKLMEIISALTRGLDESHANDNGHGTSHKRSLREAIPQVLTAPRRNLQN